MAHTFLQTAARAAQRFIATELQGTSATTNATLAGTALLVVVDASRRGEEVMLGGRITTLALVASATRDQAIFDTITPAEGQAFVYDGATYKVLSYERDALHYRLIVGHPSQ